MMIEERWQLYCALSNLIFSKHSYIRRIREELTDVDTLFSLPHTAIDELFAKKGFANKLFDIEYLKWIRSEIEWYLSKGVQLIDINSNNYPPNLKECIDAPLLLYYRGNGDLTNEKVISIVGTRLPTQDGILFCNEVVSNFVKEGYEPLIVSGLAIGIDLASHIAAIENSLQTLAVLPCGIDEIYPSSNRAVAIKIVENGGIITEFPRGVKPLKHNFLQRNRIIAGIANALVVIQSRIKGGSMSTVEYANSYSRDIFALPGRMNDINFYGCNYLISKNIAQIYLNSTTIPKSLMWGKWKSDILEQENLFSQHNEVKEKILLTLTSNNGLFIEQVVEITQLDVEIVSRELLELELDFKVQRDPVSNRYRTV